MRDLAIYLAIGLAVAAGTLWVAADTDWPADDVAKWLGLVIASAILFGSVIRDYVTYARKVLFWGLLGVLSCLHVLMFLLAIQTVGQWRLSWWVIVAPLEFVLIRLGMSALGFRPGRRPPKKPA